MTTLTIGATGLASEAIELVNTRAADDQALASETIGENMALGWSRIIDLLLEWWEDPEQLADEDIVPPSRSLIELACRTAATLSDQGLAPPLRAVPDGDGGISFEQRCGPCFTSLNIEADESIELLTFQDCKLISRLRLA